MTTPTPSAPSGEQGKPSDRKRRVFVDMDGVVVDFDAYKTAHGLTGDEVKAQVGAYLGMQPIPGAIEAVRSVIGMGYEVWMATKPPTGVPHAYSDKAAWVMQHLPELKRRIIVTHDKGLLGCDRDFLLDDRPHKANCERFAGTLLRFVDGYHWPDALRDLRAARELERSEALERKHEQSEPVVAGDFYGNGSQLPPLHNDALTSREIQVQALCARLDTARVALAAAAAMQVIQPELQRIKANAAWAMDETKPSRFEPRSVTYNAPPPSEQAGIADEVVQKFRGIILASGSNAWASTDAVREALDWYESAFPRGVGSGELISLQQQASASETPSAKDAVECHGLDTPERVCFYEQDFYVLSNFSAFNLQLYMLTFPTSEHAYHWMKFRTPVGVNTNARAHSVASEILNAPSAHEAFKIAERNKQLRRADWDAVKVDVMRIIIRAKAEQHEYVRRKLLATGDRELVENSWRDDFWGWGPNRDGQNMLGKLWIEVRAELRAAIAAQRKEENRG